MDTRTLLGVHPIIVQRSSVIHMHVVAYGENALMHKEGAWTIHAENAALQHLQSLPKKRHLKTINLMSLRTSKTGHWGHSKPCLHCILTLSSKLPLKGYKLGKIYYTEYDTFVETTLSELMADESPHISLYYKTTGFLSSS